MTPEEMKAMQGTEFIFVFNTGRTIDAYVKGVDVERSRLTCWSFGLDTHQGGKQIEVINDEERELQACCVISYSTMSKIISALKEIRDTGKFIGKGSEFFTGCNFNM